MKVLLLSGDLLTQSRVVGALGPEVQPVGTPGRLLELTDAHSLVVLDLATTGYEVADLVGQLRALPVPPLAILAFGPHVQENRLQAAAAAGCNEVFARGQFLSQAAAIVQKYG